MENFLLVAKQVAILFVLIGAGAVCRKARLVDEFSVRGMVNVLVTIVTPALIVECFQRPFESSMLAQFAIAFVVAAAMHVFLILLSRLTAHGDENSLPVLRVATVFSNAGFMGIPLEQAVLGDRGVFFGVSYIVAFNLFMWSWGYAMMKGEATEDAATRRRTRRTMLVNPGTVGLTFGLAVFLMPWKLPAFIGEPVHYMAGMNTPLAMIVIGYYLAGAKLGPVFRMRAAYVSTAIRMVVYPLLVTAALYPFRHSLDRDMMLATVIAAAAPVAAMVSMFAAKFKRDVDASVGMVSGTTILSIATLPPVVAIAMSVL